MSKKAPENAGKKSATPTKSATPVASKEQAVKTVATPTPTPAANDSKEQAQATAQENEQQVAANTADQQTTTQPVAGALDQEAHDSALEKAQEDVEGIKPGQHRSDASIHEQVVTQGPVNREQAMAEASAKGSPITDELALVNEGVAKTQQGS